MQSLARRPSASLSVACPICLAEYRIVERPGAQSVGWREMLKVASTDQQLLLRHSQFLLLLCPLVVSVCLTWAWLVAHLQDVHAHGDGARAPLPSAHSSERVGGPSLPGSGGSCVREKSKKYFRVLTRDSVW